MINVRQGVFETNSSSTHSVCIVEDNQLEKWKNGDLFFIINDNKFVSKYTKDYLIKECYGRLIMDYVEYPEYKENIINAIKDDNLEGFVKEMISEGEWDVDYNIIPLSFEEWKNYWDNEDLASDVTSYTTSKGEKLTVFCKYGYEG